MWWVHEYHGGTINGGQLRVKEKMREREKWRSEKERARENKIMVLNFSL